MESMREEYFIYLDQYSIPPMFGIVHMGGERVAGFTTDAAEAARHTERFNRLELSPIHLRDVVEDLRKS